MKFGKKGVILCLAAVIFLIFIPILGAEEGNRININKASVEELTQLKRIGNSYAQRIVQYREEQGPFEKPEDIIKVKGIGIKTFELNKGRITVE